MPPRKAQPQESIDLNFILAAAIQLCAIDVPIIRAYQSGTDLVIILANGVSVNFPLDEAWKADISQEKLSLAATIIRHPL